MYMVCPAPPRAGALIFARLEINGILAANTTVKINITTNISAKEKA
jgi:hypothetical protein